MRTPRANFDHFYRAAQLRPRASAKGANLVSLESFRRPRSRRIRSQTVLDYDYTMPDTHQSPPQPPIQLQPLTSSFCSDSGRRLSDASTAFGTTSSTVTVVGSSFREDSEAGALLNKPVTAKGGGRGEGLGTDKRTRNNGQRDGDDTDDADQDETGETDELLSFEDSSGKLSFSERRPVVYAALKASLLFVVSLLVLGLLLHTMLPPLRDEDRQSIRIPTSFDQLKALNEVLQVSLFVV